MTGEREKLSLDRSHRFIGGVCAGFARYLDMPIWVVRLLTVFAAFTFALTIAIYVVLYFVLDTVPESPGQQQPRSSSLIRKLRQFEWRRPLYKNKRRGKIQGVCTGIADYLQINPLIVRLLLLGSLFFGPLGILLYIGAAVVMEDSSTQLAQHSANRPNGEETEHRKFKSDRTFNHYVSPKQTGDAGTNCNAQTAQYMREQDFAPVDEIAVKFDGLEQRLRQLEATITSRKFQLQRELKRMAASS